MSVYSRGSGGSTWPQNGRVFGLSLKLSEIPTASKCSKSTGLMSTDAEKSETSPIRTTGQLPLFPEAILVLSEAERDQFGELSIPICPDTFLPWSESVNLGGWSAKMFLHQILVILRPHWTVSDTEQLLQTRTPLRLRAKTDGARLLSDVLKKPGYADSRFYLSDIAARGLLRRSAKRRRDILVLLRTRGDTIRAMVTFGKKEPPRLELRTARKEQNLRDFPTAGLMDYLGERWRDLQEMP